MTALSKSLCAVLLCCGFAGSAVAASNNSSSGSTNDQNSAATAQPANHISQKLHNDLSKAGFTDIKIMPSSFLVRAKDSDGNPVMMVINPDSVTEVTAGNSGAMKGTPNSQNSSSSNKQ